MLLVFLFAVGVIASPVLPCKLLDARVRREWSSLTQLERRDYIDALFCLRSLPSVLPNEEYPGVQDRFDDFVATHINYTSHIHNNGVFLSWHRHYLHLFETALRTECAFNGSIPYWNWPLHPNLTVSPLFDNSPSSLSGDGIYNPDELILCDEQVGCVGRGSGGGCVTAGPFTFPAWPANMGPLNFHDLDELYRPLDPSAFRYNPRCLMRSFNARPLHRFAGADAVQQILAAQTIQEFLAVLDPSTAGRLGAHAAVHVALGPTMGDVFSSVQDPAFFLHHAMVDRLWGMWQDAGPERRYALNGTAWMFDPPWATDVTVDTVVEFGVLGGPRKIADLMDPLGGEYCYIYS
ncbi:putative polyphenol monooxygenase [Aspergillus fischeri NRRL 181]|uniref:Tyrosinase central domain protein n=1 Tax=Neosartorya fischeri (strain ATCC 1020 / DSM 3700 / CBS 544.65 / FGSC A1164 / JCM 1740 / NRRL 181 / WB 181) TaxID=331117 RepID=A1CVX2_NEOFI|nr:tyrosinase central domain protein [Aspergillus fischeri NRRL 181]EAW24774.1 tyrosinase central domain protein [Aspergillus fischeri NRRL 181]